MFDSIDDWLIIAVVVAILFYGSSKIPQLARSLGRSIGEFKRGRMEVDREIKAEQARDAAQAATTPTAASRQSETETGTGTTLLGSNEPPHGSTGPKGGRAGCWMGDLERLLAIVQEIRYRATRILYVLAPIFAFLITFQLRPISVRFPFLPWRVPLAYPYPNFFDNVTAQVFRALVAWTLPANVTLLNVGVGDSVIVQMEIAFLLTLILGMPWLVHEVGAFLVPALRKNERRLIRQIGIPATVLFAIGTALGIVFLTPLTFRLLFLYVSAMGLQPAVGIQQFATFALLYSLAFGVVFELPVFVYSLTRLGVVKAAAWRQHWRGAVIGCLVFGMLVTPDNSPFTMTLIALPMMGLYFSGAFFAGRWERARDLQRSNEPPRVAAGA